MEGKENISEELRLISVLVAEISRETPYGLPEGYFESLSDRMLELVRTGVISQDIDIEAGELMKRLNGNAERLGPRQPEDVYSVPTGYFEGFAEKLMGRIKSGQIGEEVNSPRSMLEETGMSFTEEPSSEELAALSPLLSRIDKKMPFGVPEGYFSFLPAAAIQATKEEDYSSSLLAGLKDKPVYQTSETYFDTLADTILGKVKEQQTAPVQQPASGKVISFDRSRSLRRNWWKYAAAAVMTGLILTGGWLKLHTPASNSPVDITKSLSNVSDQEIQSYLDNQNLPLSDELANSTASLDISDNDDIKSLLGDIPDGELKQYIDENGDVKDLATN